MNDFQIIQRLFQVATKGVRHAHYHHVGKLSKTYTAFSTGVGIEDLMIKYSRREDDELFKSRCQITHQITPSITANLFDLLRKAYRSHYRRELSYGTDETNEAKTADFETFISQYAGNYGVDRYCQDRLIELNATDPNAWIIQEWKDFDNLKEYAQPYPFEASSFEAVDYTYLRSDLLYLTVETITENQELPSGKAGKYTCYQKNHTATLTRVSEKGILAINERSAFEILSKSPLQNGLYIRFEDNTIWLYNTYIHNLGEVKAKRAGYKRDKITKGQTYVWPLEAADPYFHKTLKVVSELDLTAANAAMPITIRYGDECNAPGCTGGWVEHSVCGVCKGTGHKTSPTSVMEEIVITPMPSSPDTMVDLSRLITHVAPPVDILNWQTAYVDALEKKCKAAVLNSEIYSRNEVTATATEKSIEQDNANDFVYHYFVFYAEFWQFVVYSIADITAKRSGLIAKIHVNKDLKLKTLNQLLEDLKQCNDSGAGPAAKQAIEWDIMRALTIDNPNEFAEYQVRERFNPFSGFTPEQIVYSLQSPYVPTAQKVLYSNLGYIFDQIEYQTQNFYKLPYESQKALIDAKVKEIELLTTPQAPQIAA